MVAKKPRVILKNVIELKIGDTFLSVSGNYFILVLDKGESLLHHHPYLILISPRYNLDKYRVYLHEMEGKRWVVQK